MAFSFTGVTGASTLGFATPEDLRDGSWNMGLPQANSFAKFGKIYGLLEDAAQKIKLMGEYCHVIVLNELHVAHQGRLDNLLVDAAPTMKMIGFASGDVVICSVLSRCHCRMASCSCLLPWYCPMLHTMLLVSRCILPCMVPCFLPCQVCLAMVRAMFIAMSVVSCRVTCHASFVLPRVSPRQCCACHCLSSGACHCCLSMLLAMLGAILCAAIRLVHTKPRSPTSPRRLA